MAEDEVASEPVDLIVDDTSELDDAEDMAEVIVPDVTLALALSVKVAPPPTTMSPVAVPLMNSLGTLDT